MELSRRKKRLYLAVGLMALLIFALLWQAGQYMQGARGSRREPHRTDARTLAMQPAVVTKKISASVPAEAHAAGGDQPAVVYKKLPPMPSPPAQKVEPQPVAGAPAPEPATAVEAIPKKSPASEPLAVPAAAPPAPEAPMAAPEKPILAKPPAPVPPPAPAAPQAAPAPSVVQAAREPSPRPVAAKTIAKATPSKRGAYPFSLLLSSNRGKANALTTLPDYRRKGLEPYLAYTDLGEKGKWWRTLYGYYPSLEDALQVKKSLNLVEAVVVITPFANLIGEYPSEKEASDAAAQLNQKGLFPYTVKGSQDTVRLMSGAFPTRQEAEQQQRELEAQGITAQTVQR
ncbi:MAG: SPOR domain-containing protein [Hyphomicrobiales bacterium]